MTIKTIHTAFRLPRDLLGRLDRYVESIRPKTTRTAVIIQAVEEYLERQKPEKSPSYTP